MPRRAQPVPPIFQPEVAAEAILFAARNPRRELMVGWPTVKAILGNAVVPGLADRYLARTGFDSQQTDEPSDTHRPNNLEQPADENRDYGTRGPFDAKSTDRSPQLWASHHHGLLGALGAVGLGAVAAGLAARRSR
jgi:hypothetical protein